MGFVEPIFSNQQNVKLEENNENSQQNAGSETGIQEKTPYSINKHKKDEDTERQEENPVTISKEAPDQSNERDNQSGNLPASTTQTASGVGQVQSSERFQENALRLPSTPRKNVIPQRRTSFEAGQQSPRIAQRTALSSDGPHQSMFNQQPATNELQAHNSEAQVVQALTPGKANLEPSAVATLPPHEPISVPPLEDVLEVLPIAQPPGEPIPVSPIEEATEPRLAALPPHTSPPVAPGEEATEPRLAALPAHAPTPPPTTRDMPETPLTAQPPREYIPAPWSGDDLVSQLATMPGSWSKSQPVPIPRAWSENILLDPIIEQGNDASLEQQKQLQSATMARTAAIETQKMPAAEAHSMLMELPTTPLLATRSASLPRREETRLTRGWAFCLALLLIIVIINATTLGFNQFFGPQGWGSAFNTSNGNGGQSLLKQISNQLHSTPTPGVTPSATVAPTPQQIINALLANMTLEQKIGQMLMVRFNGQDYSPQLDAMITQYHVGSVIEYQTNIGNKSQLISLNSQIQHNAELPVIISIDQEGGTVDRLADLDGAQPSATSIGESGNTNKAYQQGLTDAQDLASYGFNLNLAPVVDVNNVYNSQLYLRTYGNNPATVTEMAEAYLKGLQQSSKVLGTLKHFPGLGDTSTDPHTGLPYLTRSLSELGTIDWAPYQNLINQGNVYSIMVTHEIVKALDTTMPSSLSPKVVGILRNQLHFNGVIITDGLTMDAIINRYTLGQAATMAIEAGDDLLMDPGSPNEVAQMVDAIKQAINSGTITEQRIDESVSRILLFKYQMGLLNVNP